MYLHTRTAYDKTDRQTDRQSSFIVAKHISKMRRISFPIFWRRALFVHISKDNMRYVEIIRHRSLRSTAVLQLCKRMALMMENMFEIINLIFVNNFCFTLLILQLAQKYWLGDYFAATYKCSPILCRNNYMCQTKKLYKQNLKF